MTPDSLELSFGIFDQDITTRFHGRKIILYIQNLMVDTFVTVLIKVIFQIVELFDTTIMRVHFLPYKELTFFKLFAWTNSTYPVQVKFEEFTRDIESKELLDCYDKIVASHRLIPSKEIWTKNTTDTFIKLIIYHFEMGHFSDLETPLSLCDQFLGLLNTLEHWTGKGDKGEAGGVPFLLYLSDVDMENSFNLLKGDGQTSCILKLFTINSLYITDRQFCTEADNWLEHLSRRATLISGASEKERHKFFNSQRQKIRFLTDMISNQQIDIPHI